MPDRPDSKCLIYKQKDCPVAGNVLPEVQSTGVVTIFECKFKHVYFFETRTKPNPKRLVLKLARACPWEFLASR